MKLMEHVHGRDAETWSCGPAFYIFKYLLMVGQWQQLALYFFRHLEYSFFKTIEDVLSRAGPRGVRHLGPRLSYVILL